MVSPSSPTSPEPIGQLLKRAGLLSDAQIQLALRDQSNQQDLLFGEILILRGWIKPMTLDFFLAHFVRAAEDASVPLKAHPPDPLPPTREDLASYYSYAPAPKTGARKITTSPPSSSGIHASPKTGSHARPHTKISTPPPGKVFVNGFCVQEEGEDDELLEELLEEDGSHFS